MALRAALRRETLLLLGRRMAGSIQALGSTRSTRRPPHGLAVSAAPLGALLPAGALPDRLLRRLRIRRYSTAAVKLDDALARPVPWTAVEARDAAVIPVGGDLREPSATAEAAQRGELPQPRAGDRPKHPV